jgi:hypothetical protein
VAANQRLRRAIMDENGGVLSAASSSAPPKGSLSQFTQEHSGLLTEDAPSTDHSIVSARPPPTAANAVLPSKL